ncbi:cyclic di-GMP phosphodiesterase [Enterobacter sp. CC120223-11]|uniref:cyclic di-GMP phosphodiesterase n=1 Tax=Enterobacter sp. CC120223-11 TaxID=1378073 RepID=UPI000BD19EF5|nr:cyclic di-GMP phosphodiesterase [Enterobacter sp. CC120223-11]SNY63529.1 EAL domain, c-di-GMP-specific phosphodiesterase class I (or its enzymatically inactive variant) [Enterobacter sp. CC120223-11]
MFTRYFSLGRKILFSSLLLGTVVALLAGCFQLMIFHHKRAEQFDSIAHDLQKYLNNYFGELLTTIDKLQPLTLSHCENVAAELTSRAAFSLNVRAFLLVDNGNAFCSSATGEMSVPMKQLVPQVDVTKALDLSILPGTPMMPQRAAFALWVRSPLLENRGVFTSINASLMPWILYSSRQNQFSGISVVANGIAVSTFSPNPQPVSMLREKPIRSAKIDGLPLTVNVYGDAWASENMQFSLLMGVMCGLLSGLLCYYVLSVRLRPGKEITSAIKRNQFYVVYQPVVEAENMQIRGVEVLMRWKHPTAGEIPPDAFINFAEAQQLIVPLTRHLFDLIAKDAPVLQRMLPPGAKLGINIAPAHLLADSFKQDLRDLSSMLPPNYFQLVLEITERDMLNQRQAVSLFEWLHHEGYEIAIDDFGTGHSALIYLERYSFDYLKIDRGFVNAIGTETVTSPVLDAVLSLARKMNIVTVAEGVETQEQASWLRQHGVNFMQGYWISRPLTLEKLLEAHAKPENYFTTG